jgi:hypothetical protein
MERIVYLLGAGFSAPLGIPTMGNFLIKSKDMYFENPDSYGYFIQIFERLDRMSKAKNYYTTDLFNIEEILSIWEMEASIGGGIDRSLFVDYLSDVIKYYTPLLNDSSKAQKELLTHYSLFVGNIMNAVRDQRRVISHEDNMLDVSITTKRDLQRTVEYSIVSLNYDMLLETLWATFNGASEYKFGLESNAYTVCLAKLHGSIDTDIMVFPTWNKSINVEAKKVWEAAYKALSTANQLRFIGYSLPVADAYVKYLLKSAVLESRHLKQIDIILKATYRLPNDYPYPEKLRYREFISFEKAQQRGQVQKIEFRRPAQGSE